MLTGTTQGSTLYADPAKDVSLGPTTVLSTLSFTFENSLPF